MYIIKVLSNGVFEEFELAGKFARKERAEGALTTLQRLGEDRPMQVELVNPGKRGNVGRTEHGAELATAVGDTKNRDPKRYAQLCEAVARARAAKAAKRASVREEVVLNKHDARTESVTITAEGVARLIGSIRPGAPGSGEYVLDVSQLNKVDVTQLKKVG